MVTNHTAANDNRRRMTEAEREALVRQYWRCAAAVYPNGVPPGFELCRAFETEWSPSAASPPETRLP